MLILLMGDPAGVDTTRLAPHPCITCFAGWYRVTERWSLQLQTPAAVAIPG